MLFKEIKSVDINAVFGGFCQCICNRKQNEVNHHDIGKAKSLEECSSVCLANGWEIETCSFISKKDK